MSNNSFGKSFQSFDARYAKVLIPNRLLNERRAITLARAVARLDLPRRAVYRTP